MYILRSTKPDKKVISSEKTSPLKADQLNPPKVNLHLRLNCVRSSDKLSESLRHPCLTYIEQDIQSRDWNLDALVSGADLVIDLIAYAHPGLYVTIALEVFRLNFTENLKIAEACVWHGKRLIQFSTCEVYGRTAASLKNANVADPKIRFTRPFRRTSRNSSSVRSQSTGGSMLARSSCWSGYCMPMASKQGSITASSGHSILSDRK